MITIVFDPSGNFYEGKGTTGFVIARNDKLIKAGQIYAADYESQLLYWHNVILLIQDYVLLEGVRNIEIVCEDYRLYASACNSQINSNLETPQLIGVLKYWCYTNNVPITLQMAHLVKNRYSNGVLEATGEIIRNGKYWYHDSVKLEHHSMDAFRHWLYYKTFHNPVNFSKPKIHLTEYSNY